MLKCKRENKTESHANRKIQDSFFTTSDLLNTINSVIKDDNPKTETGFELQRRLPDGQTTRPATKDEITANDFQIKIQQAVQQTVNLTPKEKITWSKELRSEGNVLFQEKDYRKAMDIYLICLVGLHGTAPSKGETVLTEVEEEAEIQIQLPVLINLSLCSMKLGMYRKVVEFCNFALDLKCGKINPKPYYLRGKALMLSGESYEDASTDFKKSLSFVDSNDTTEIEAIQKELAKLTRLQNAAKENKKKCKKAMKVILNQEYRGNEKKVKEEPLYSDVKRTYSTLRATRKNSKKQEIVKCIDKKQVIAQDSEKGWIKLLFSLVLQLFYNFFSIFKLRGKD